MMMMMQYKGPLLKWTNVVNGWQYRYCVLQMDVGILSYYLTKRNAADGNRKGCVRLKNSIVGIDDDVSKHFTITDDTGRTLYFEGETLESKNNWVKVLQNTIAQHSVLNMHVKRVQKMLVESDERERRRQWVDKFDASIREADYFFQLVDKTRKQLVSSSQLNTAAVPASSSVICAPNGSADCTEVNNNVCSGKLRDADRSTANVYMLQDFLLKSEELMHAVNDVIINLQIAKNNVFSDEHIRTESLEMYKMKAVSEGCETDCSDTGAVSRAEQVQTEATNAQIELEPNVEITHSSSELCRRPLITASPVVSESIQVLADVSQFTAPALTQDVSFSEDELSDDDQFYDANEAFSTEEGHGSISGEDSDGNMKTSSLFGGCGANNSSSSYSAVASDDRNNTLIDTHSFHQNLGITGSCYDEAGSTNENLNFNTQPTGLMSQRTLNLKDFERNGSIDCDSLFNHLRQNSCTTTSANQAPSLASQESNSLHTNQNQSCSHTEASKGERESGEDATETNDSGLHLREKVETQNEMVLLSSSSNVNSTEHKLLSYDEDQEEDELDLDTLPRSVITHLLSQIKIGFDLTTINLPIQIMEKRSLLEMYADFCANPQFVRKTDECTTPKDRFLMLLKWYLSAFKSGRKPIPKKPYNPIIGEIFQCYYTVPRSSDSDDILANTNLNTVINESSKLTTTVEKNGNGIDSQHSTDGPVPWAKENDIAFIAEQVSHRPPISCFYAESPAYNFQMTGHIWTRSKFLGLSIAVDLVGEAIVKLLNHNESYRVTFPSAYGRNILGVPWSELGGNCVLEGIDTGYRAEIEFRTRGGLKFTSVERDSVRAKVFDPNDRQFGSIQGLWTGTMYANFNNGDEEVFVDTVTMATSRKRVRPLHEQQPHESRIKWKLVTKALTERKIEEAQKQKKILEDVQRAEEGERKKSGVKYVPKHFEAYRNVNGLDHYRFKSDLLRKSRPQEMSHLSTTNHRSAELSSS